MAKHIVLYSDYYLEEIQRQHDTVTGAPSRGGRSKYREVDPEEIADNRKQVIGRARKNVIRYVMHNFRPAECHMITLTIRPEFEWSSDLKSSVQQFRWFLKRLRRHLKKQVPGYILKYVSIAEFHDKRDAVHFHMISDLPLSAIRDLPDIWKHGFINTDLVKDREELLKRAGYLGKSFSDPRLGQGVDLYWPSRSVKPPRRVNDHEADVIMDALDKVKGKPLVTHEYESEYQGHTVYNSWAFYNFSLNEKLEEVNWT